MEFKNKITIKFNLISYKDELSEVQIYYHLMFLI